MLGNTSTSGRLHSDFVCFLFLQTHRETDCFFSTSGGQVAQSNNGQFYYRRAAFSSQLKSKYGNILVKPGTLRIILNIDGSPLTSRTHTHPSYSQTSRSLTSSLSLGVPVPWSTQCMWDMSHILQLYPSTLSFSLLSHRHSYKSLLFRSRFIFSQ